MWRGKSGNSRLWNNDEKMEQRASYISNYTTQLRSTAYSLRYSVNRPEQNTPREHIYLLFKLPVCVCVRKCECSFIVYNVIFFGGNFVLVHNDRFSKANNELLPVFSEQLAGS